ncbi:hypothetical protein [Sneathiella sp.]|jgi:molybdopterin molybdotransferase|uniref:hypothetical protein n=1 Tax=Sneathiella sp. TaxID=1964365 RepID=UPI0039E48935
MHFDLIVVVDWSAAASKGPKKPTADRCWIAWQNQSISSEAEYFPTRSACMKRLHALVSACPGSALLAFDFPFGYPYGSGLKGGREAAKLIQQHLISNEDDTNNRFSAANVLNKQISASPGPFWGHPVSMEFEQLTRKKPAFQHPFAEWRVCEKYLKDRGHPIMNVWQLYGQGSVGSQTLTGLHELIRFTEHKNIAKRARFWPFETHWDLKLDGIILAETWPSLSNHTAIDHPIKDARQVLACRNWITKTLKEKTLSAVLGAPDLSQTELLRCEKEEGWILGVGSEGL